MIQVRFFEGPIEDGQVLDDLEMPVVPRVGETVTFRIERVPSKYTVDSVDFTVDIWTADSTIKSKFIGASISLTKI